MNSSNNFTNTTSTSTPTPTGPKISEQFEIIFESDKTLSFENANEQGASYKASVRENHKNKPGSKLFTKDNNWDSDDEDFEHVSRKSKKGTFLFQLQPPERQTKCGIL